MVRQHYAEYFHNEQGEIDPTYAAVRAKTCELCEFLVDVLKVEKIDGQFPHQVGLHASCHGLRELRLGKASELGGADFNKARQLLSGLDGIRFTELKRPDECCGFWGTFCSGRGSRVVHDGERPDCRSRIERDRKY